MSKIKTNTLRKRAKKLPDVTDEMWKLVDDDYREFAEEFISVQNFSPQTKKQYTSGLRQFGWYIYDSMNNKKLYKITKRDFMRYMSYLRDNRKMSSSAQGFKKSCVSSFCNYVENMIVGEVGYENYNNFRNFTRGLPAIPKNQVYEKVNISFEEYQEMMKVLESDENYLGMAWLATAFNVGARRAEIVQFKTEILDYEFPEDRTYIETHNIRLKGRGEDGKISKYMVNEEALKYMKLWVEKRGYDHEYIFTVKHEGDYHQMSDGWANYFCSNVLSDILGRRINPHLFKASCVTYLLEQGVPLKDVSKFVAHHENIQTTINHYDLRENEDEKNKIFAK